MDFSELENKSWEELIGRKAPNLYVLGILKAAEKHGITIEQAAERLRKDLHDVEGLEHLEQLNFALEVLQQHPEARSINSDTG